MVKDLTNGKPLKLIMNFCLPLMLGQFVQQLYNVVDSIIVGKFAGTAELSAVGSVGSICFMVIGFISGFTTGISIPISQAFGAGDETRVRKLFANCIYLSAAMSIVLTVVTYTLSRPILKLMNTPDEIFEMAYDYISVCFLGLTAIFFYNLLAAVMRSLGDSKTPLILLTSAPILNIFLDLFFVLKLHMACKGVAIATVISQGLSAVLGMIIIIKKFKILHFNKSEAKPSIKMVGKLVGSGLPMGLQISVTAIGSIMLQSAVNVLGQTAIAAVTVGGKIQLFLILPTESIGIAMATYCGQNLGAKKIERIKTGLINSIGIGIVYSCIAAVIAYAFGSKLGILFVNADQTDVLASIGQFLRTCCFFYPILTFVFIFRNSIQGLGYSTTAMFAGAFELAARAVMSYVVIPKFAYNAVCYANPAAWAAADLFLIPAFIAVYVIVKRKVTKQAAQ